MLTNCDSRLFVISIEDLLVGISIKLQNTPEKRRYSNFDLLVTLKNSIIIAFRDTSLELIDQLI